MDVLLPKMGFAGAVELFFIVAITDQIGGEAISKRIREQLGEWENTQQSGLTFSTFHRPIKAIKQSESEPAERVLEKLDDRIQELMNEEISLRMVLNGQ